MTALPLFNSKRVETLTDAAQALFGSLYDLERVHKQVTKARLAIELAHLDLFAAEPNHEDYAPGGGES